MYFPTRRTSVKSEERERERERESMDNGGTTTKAYALMSCDNAILAIIK